MTTNTINLPVGGLQVFRPCCPDHDVLHVTPSHVTVHLFKYHHNCHLGSNSLIIRFFRKPPHFRFISIKMPTYPTPLPDSLYAVFTDVSLSYLQGQSTDACSEGCWGWGASVWGSAGVVEIGGDNLTFTQGSRAVGGRQGGAACLRIPWNSTFLCGMGNKRGII